MKKVFLFTLILSLFLVLNKVNAIEENSSF
jgi:hypothetical protein